MATPLDELRKNEFWQRKMRTLIKVRDTNQDGWISCADFKLVMQRYKEMGASQDHLRKMDRIYTDILKATGLEDETVTMSYEEFGAVLEKFSRESKEAQDPDALLSIYFELVDSDGNGEISFKEWVEHYKAQGIDTKYARASFDAMDTDGDGIVSKGEYLAYSKEFFNTTEDKLHSSILYGPLVDIN